MNWRNSIAVDNPSHRNTTHWLQRIKNRLGKPNWEPVLMLGNKTGKTANFRPCF